MPYRCAMHRTEKRKTKALYTSTPNGSRIARKWFTNRSRMVHELLANGSRTARERFASQMCICKDGTANLCCAICERSAYCLFAANQNLLLFCTNTKRTGCAGCPFHAPGVLCSSQVRGKLINRAPLMHHM